MGGLPLLVEAVYEKGVLRTLRPLELPEHEHVLLSVLHPAEAPSRCELAVGYIERVRSEVQNEEPAPGREELRRRLAAIPGSMAAEIIAERGDR